MSTLHVKPGYIRKDRRKSERRLHWVEGVTIFYVDSAGICTPRARPTSTPNSINPHLKERK